MRIVMRVLALVFLAAIVVPSLMVWDATGRHGITRMPSADLAAMQQNEGKESSLFGDKPSLPPIENTFALGLLPAGLGPEALSVVSVGVPAMFLTLMTFCRGCRRGGAAK